MRSVLATARPLPEAFVREAAQLVRRRTGLVISEGRRDAFVHALEGAMRDAGVPEPVVYLADLAAAPALLDALVGAITVGETYFFREPQQFELLRARVIPEVLVRSSGSGPLRVWSAGCATGEEPYSIAILLSELGVLDRARILATDISRPALGKAGGARYGNWSFRGVRPDVVAKYFTADGNRFELVTEIRSAVEFRYLNLAEASYPSAASGVGDLDIVMCRNVLIYFDGPSIAEVTRRLVGSLREGGWLLFGAADPVIGGVPGCEVVMTPAGLAYRRSTKTRPGRAPSAAVVTTSPAPSPRLPTWRSPRGLPAPTAGPVPGTERPRSGLEPVGATAARIVPPHADGADEVRALAGRGELAEAERACVQALERGGSSAELYVLHAMLLTGARRYEAAAVAARRALYLDRSLAVAHLALGAALAGASKVAGARRSFAAAERLLVAMPADDPAPASGSEPAGRLAELARVELELLREAVA